MSGPTDGPTDRRKYGHTYERLVDVLGLLHFLRAKPNACSIWPLGPCQVDQRQTSVLHRQWPAFAAAVAVAVVAVGSLHDVEEEYRMGATRLHVELVSGFGAPQIAGREVFDDLMDGLMDGLGRKSEREIGQQGVHSMD